MDYRNKRHEFEKRRAELQLQLFDISAKKRLLDQQSAAAEQELRALDQILTAMEMAVGRIDAPTPSPPGLTEYVRSLMANTEVPLTAIQIRDSCVAVGIRGTSRRNFLISVHTVLKRLGLKVKERWEDGRQITYFLPRPSLLSAPKRQRKH
jgi:hypothetical protein